MDCDKVLLLGAFDMRVEPCRCQRLQASSPECKRSTACFGAFLLVVKMEMTIDLWKSMTSREQTLWLEVNCKLNGIGGPRGKVCSAGINDANYRTKPRIGGVIIACPAYQTWVGMIKRAHSKEFQSNNQTYIGVTVCNEWLSFSSFRKWWLKHHVDDFALDKDILCESREYSPSACLFVPQWLNNFTIDRGVARGDWPIGVYLDRSTGKFKSQCRNPSSGKYEHLGRFSEPVSAHLAWRNRKLDLALELKPKMDEIDLRIYPRIVEIINNAR